MTLRSAWTQARSRLERAGIDDASLESEVLLRHALGIDRATFFASLEEQSLEEHPDDSALGLAQALVGRREGGEPLAYILGRREFYGLDLLVTPTVLIPRQETELLVDTILELGGGRSGLTLADVGTGSGAIAVAAAVNLPGSRVYATDSSEAALRVAKDNCRRHHVEDRVELRHGDLLHPWDVPVDLIASNPPYVMTGEIEGLDREVRREPIEALDGGPDGLGVMRRLFEQAPAALRPGGAMLVEIDPRQLKAVISLASATFPGGRVSYRGDLSGLPRVVVVAT